MIFAPNGGKVYSKQAKNLFKKMDKLVSKIFLFDSMVVFNCSKVQSILGKTDKYDKFMDELNSYLLNNWKCWIPKELVDGNTSFVKLVDIALVTERMLNDGSSYMCWTFSDVNNRLKLSKKEENRNINIQLPFKIPNYGTKNLKIKGITDAEIKTESFKGMSNNQGCFAKTSISDMRKAGKKAGKSLKRMS